jgi:putative phage-type endonuclease
MNNELLDKNVFVNVNKYTVENSDKNELTPLILSLIEDIIIEEPIILASPNHRERMIDNIMGLVSIQFEDIFGNPIEPYIEEYLNKLIGECLEIYYLLFAPKRSYTTTFIRKPPNVRKMEKKILYLSEVPQPDQRTDEWYVFRHKYLTASSIWKVFATPGSRNQLIYDKCKPLNTEKYKGFCTDSPMHWGHKYEPLSILWYEYTYKTTISDFGCIPHKNIDFIAASPDGINTCNKSGRYGRMLEVKNIVNRIISGIPKMEYWIQMQLQMEVCELNECDFLETRFKEYETREDFYNDGDTFQKTKDNKNKGVMLYFIKDGQPLYEYAPFMCSVEEFRKWEADKMIEHADITWMQNIYWFLEEISCILVLRNKTWFLGALIKLNDFWKTIQDEKNGGYEHRAPKKREKKLLARVNVQSSCIINVAKLGGASNEKAVEVAQEKSNIINIVTSTLEDENYPHILDDDS